MLSQHQCAAGIADGLTSTMSSPAWALSHVRQRTMSTLVRAVTRRIAATDRLAVGGITLRLILFVVSFAVWVLLLREQRDRGELILASIVVLTGFVMFTSAVNDILRVALLGRPSHVLQTANEGGHAMTDDPEVLASILVAQAPPSRRVLTLGDATRTLVQQVGPLPVSQVTRALEVLVRLQWCAVDYDEATDQQCWRLTATMEVEPRGSVS